MPSVRGIPGPYRVHFTSFDCAEPPHVHVEREGKVCKFWLKPWRHGVSTVTCSDPRIQEVRVTRDLITAHLFDGRVISVDGLLHGTPAPRPSIRKQPVVRGAVRKSARKSGRR